MAYRTVSFGQTYGSLGTVGYRLRGSNGTLGSRVTAGVSEVVTGSGTYAANVDESSLPVGIVWDTAVSSLVVASEDFTERSALGMASADLDTQLDAILAAAGSGGVGNGDIAVDHNYGGADALQITDGNGDPLDDALISAWEADAYAVGTKSQYQTHTGSDGRWTAPLMLDAGNYVVIVSKPGKQSIRLGTGDPKILEVADAD